MQTEGVTLLYVLSILTQAVAAASSSLFTGF